MKRTCSKLAHCIQQLELPTLLHFVHSTNQLGLRRFNVEFQPKSVDIPICSAPKPRVFPFGPLQDAQRDCLEGYNESHAPKERSSKGSESPSLVRITLPVDVRINLNACLPAGHRGPGVCPYELLSTIGSTRPNCCHTCSLLMRLCSMTSSRLAPRLG